MLKKAIITSAAAVAATVVTMIGTAGVAYAGDFDGGGSHADHGGHSHGSHGHGSHGDGSHAHGVKNSPDCSSHEKTTQVNKGTQGIGNIVAKHINGGIAGSIEKPGLCPSIGNDNKID